MFILLTTTLFKPHHARWYGAISFEIRFTGSSVATSDKYIF